jgi:hypothetical protein
MPFKVNVYPMRNLFLHCSARNTGSILTIRDTHRARGFSEVGYSFAILNGRPAPDVNYIPFLDGQIQPGRPFDDDANFESKEIGAHVLGRNYDSIGVCLISKTGFTNNQLISAKTICHWWKSLFNRKTEDILGHYEDPNTEKTCPNIPMDEFRLYVDSKITVDDLQVHISKFIAQIYP